MGTELNKALAAFQAEIPKVAKRLTADMGTFQSSYAPLEDVTDAAMPSLGKHGLALTSFPTINAAGRPVLAYALLHASGEERTGEYPLPDRGTPQQMGSAITYARRYILCAVTGIAPAGEDDDGAAAEKAPKARAAQSRPRPPQRPTAATTRTPTTGAGHERLRNGTVERTPEDRPAERGPLPGERDHWKDQPAGHLPAGNGVSGTVGMIQQHFKRLEVLDREERLGLTAKLAGLPAGEVIDSSNDLSADDARRVLKLLEKCRNYEALTALVTHGERPGSSDD